MENISTQLEFEEYYDASGLPEELVDLFQSLWIKVLNEEISISKYFKEGRAESVREAMGKVRAIHNKLVAVLAEDGTPNGIVSDIAIYIANVLERQSSCFHHPIQEKDLPLLDGKLSHRFLRDVWCTPVVPESLAIGKRLDLCDGYSIVIKEVGRIAFASHVVFRVYVEVFNEKEDSLGEETFVVKRSSSSESLEWQRLKNIGLPVFDTYVGVGGNSWMDDLDENGERITTGMNHLGGSISGYYLCQSPVKELSNWGDSFLVDYFDCPQRAARAGRKIPAIAYFFNVGKEPITDLRFILGDYGELEGYVSRNTSANKPLIEYNLHEALCALESFLECVTKDSSGYTKELREFYKKILK